MKKVLTLFFYLCIAARGVSQTADFTWQSTSGLYCTPSVIKFTNRSSGTPIGYAWTFGNNNRSNAVNPTITFSTAGTYTVKLITIYKNKTVSVSKSIVINPAVAAHVGFNRNTVCKEETIQFTANSTIPVSSFEWNFGDNTGIVSTNSATISHFFSSYGTFPISLKATARTGCFGQSFTTIIVKRPKINATVTPVSGCIPAVASFSATVSDLPVTGVVTSYVWEFGDGSAPFTTTTSNVSHTYHAAGNFIPKLRITTNEGCTNEYIFEKITFGTPPLNHTAYSKKQVICGSESAWFVSKATNANKYFWDFGEGDTTTVRDTITLHKFKTLGIKTISVIPYYNDCPGTPVSFTMNVIGVIAAFNYSNTCTNKKLFTLNNITQGNQSTIKWNFGDESPAMFTFSGIHNFPDTGTFKTSLYVTDSITGCIDSFSRILYTAEPLLINPDSSVCRKTNTTFQIPQNYNNPNALYTWDVIGLRSGPDKKLPLTVNPLIHGYFNDNSVIINNGPQYCPDTIKLNRTIIVRGPALNFTGPSEICLNSSYTVLNLSKPYISADSINVWKWHYGIDGQFAEYFQPEPYNYPYWGAYEVKLTATDINGCRDTIIKPVTIYDMPFLRSISNVDHLCAGQSATLIAFHNDPIIWTPQNLLSCNTCDTIKVLPPVTTTYYIKATGRFNCSTTDSIVINVFEPFNSESAKDDNYICANDKIQLQIGPKNKKITWSPAIGLSDSTVYDPVATPKQSTTYTATLIDSVGCFSSSTPVSVIVKSLPTVEAGPNNTYPYLTNYSIMPLYSNNIRSYNWEPSTLLSCNNCSIPMGSAESTQTYTVTVVSDSGCVAKDKVTIFVECKGANILLPTAFTPNNDNLNDYYYPMARGIKKITRFSVYDRQGHLVFERKDFLPNNKQSGWDGNIKGIPGNPGAYVYSLEAICEIGETIYSKGSFLLVR